VDDKIEKVLNIKMIEIEKSQNSVDLMRKLESHTNDTYNSTRYTMGNSAHLVDTIKQRFA
jgi:hypothetical protein